MKLIAVKSTVCSGATWIPSPAIVDLTYEHCFVIEVLEENSTTVSVLLMQSDTQNGLRGGTSQYDYVHCCFDSKQQK